MIVDAIKAGRKLLERDFVVDPIESDQIARWLEKHETVKDYDRKKFLDPTLWEKTRKIVLARDHNQCLYPDIHHSKRLQVHHMEPLHAGGDPYAIYGLATLCIVHHALMHPGLPEAYKRFRSGDKDAFRKFSEEEHKRTCYEPTPEAHLVRGILIERMRHYNEQMKVTVTKRVAVVTYG